MTTQLESALAAKITEENRRAGLSEGLEARALMDAVARGRAVIPANVGHRDLHPVAVGEGTRTKVNANIGTSPDRGDAESELAKLAAALEAGADAVMDLSTGGDIDGVRRAVVEHSCVPVGTVPMYQAAIESGGPEEMTLAAYLEVLERHARDGVDFATVHAGVTREALPLVDGRVMGAVSRGGVFMLNWMRAHDRQSFLYEGFEEVLAIAREYDVTMSLGDGLRPGCIADATDEAQLHELRILGELTRRCREAGVQVMVEGPGHIPLHEVEENVRLQKDWCDGAPFYVLGPLPTDIAPGYDHVVGAIGGALAGACGADFLCYVTPMEHVGLPGPDDVYEGVIATRIAAHIADIAKGVPAAVERDRLMGEARGARDWDAMLSLALTSRRFGDMLAGESREDRCSMCGQFCAVKLFREASEHRAVERGPAEETGISSRGNALASRGSRGTEEDA